MSLCQRGEVLILQRSVGGDGVPLLREGAEPSVEEGGRLRESFAPLPDQFSFKQKLLSPSLVQFLVKRCNFLFFICLFIFHPDPYGYIWRGARGDSEALEELSLFP